MSRIVRCLGRTLACALAYALLTPEGAGRHLIRVGICPDPPLAFLDASAAPQGIYVDLLEPMASQEGWQLQCVSGSWRKALRACGGGSTS